MWYSPDFLPSPSHSCTRSFFFFTDRWPASCLKSYVWFEAWCVSWHSVDVGIPYLSPWANPGSRYTWGEMGPLEMDENKWVTGGGYNPVLHWYLVGAILAGLQGGSVKCWRSLHDLFNFHSFNATNLFPLPENKTDTQASAAIFDKLSHINNFTETVWRRKKQVCTYNPAVLLFLEGEKKRLEKEQVNRIGKNHWKTLGPTMETRMLLDTCKHRRLEVFTTNLRHAITELHPITPYQWESWMEIHPRLILILCEEILHHLGYLKHSNQWEKTSTICIYIQIIFHASNRISSVNFHLTGPLPSQQKNLTQPFRTMK